MKFPLVALMAMSGVLASAQEKEVNVMRAPTPATAAGAGFMAPSALDYTALLPPPPSAGSLAAQAELDVVLQVQAWRTPEQVAWAKLVEKDQVFNHAAVLGAWFTAERLPRTAAFFKTIGDDLRAIDAASKRPFQRARPWTIDARVEPCVTKPASNSYPSGSAMQSLVWAELLAELVPAKRDELIARAHRAGWGRVLGGVHWPSDVTAGRVLAVAYLAEVRKSADFRAAFAAAQAEVAGVAR